MRSKPVCIARRCTPPSDPGRDCERKWMGKYHVCHRCPAEDRTQDARVQWHRNDHNRRRSPDDAGNPREQTVTPSGGTPRGFQRTIRYCRLALRTDGIFYWGCSGRKKTPGVRSEFPCIFRIQAATNVLLVNVAAARESPAAEGVEPKPRSRTPSPSATAGNYSSITGSSYLARKSAGIA